MGTVSQVAGVRNGRATLERETSPSKTTLTFTVLALVAGACVASGSPTTASGPTSRPEVPAAPATTVTPATAGDDHAEGGDVSFGSPEVEPSDAGTDLPAGRCAEPVPTDVGPDGLPTVEATTETVLRFLADRERGLRAQACLSVGAARAYDEHGEMPLCLFDCPDGAVLVPEPDRIVSPAGEGDGRFVSVLLTFRYPDGATRTLREEYEVRAVPDGDGGHRTLITGVIAEPDSWVPDRDARRVVEDLLEALTDGAYDAAAAYLVSEGVAGTIEERLGDIWHEEPADLFSRFCRHAACGVSYEITGTEPTSLYVRTVEVRFDLASGSVTVPIGVGAFEGFLTAQDLPPEGDGSTLPLFPRRLFRGRDHRPVAVIRYRHVVVEGLGGEPGWFLWYRADRAARPMVVGEWLVAHDLDRGEIVAGRLIPGERVTPEFVAPAGEVAGVAGLDGSPVVLVTDFETLTARNLETGDESILMDIDGEEKGIVSASIGGNRLLVTFGLGDASWFELFTVDAAGIGRSLAVFRQWKAPGAGVLAPDGQTMAFSVETGVHRPDTVVVASTDGEELGRWMAPEGTIVYDVDYDGRFVVTGVGPRDGWTDAVWVIDTVTGEDWTVASTAAVGFVR